MIAVDVETSGTKFKENSILSIGAVCMKDPSKRFYGECRAWDGAVIDPGALKVNGFTEFGATDPSKKTEGDLMLEFRQWVWDIEEKPVMCGHNVSFDNNFVQAAFERIGERSPFSYRAIDTHTIGWYVITMAGCRVPNNLSLNKLLEGVGAGREPEPHNALTGAMCAAEIISRMTTGKTLFPGEFNQITPK